MKKPFSLGWWLHIHHQAVAERSYLNVLIEEREKYQYYCDLTNWIKERINKKYS